MTYDEVTPENMDEANTQDISAQNLASGLDEDLLMKIGEICKRGYETDLDSRSEWDTAMEEWIKLAKQHRANKTYPWPKASNVKYPLLSTAAMQFAARAYPSLVPSNGKIVKTVVIGKDPTGEKYEKSERVSTYMSYQVMHDMDCWEEDMDRMLMMLPVVGTMFKKTWYDRSEDKIRSKVILPQNIIVNNWTKNLNECERISEVIEMSPRLVKERQNQKLFLDVDLGVPQRPDHAPDSATADDTLPYTLIEQHTFYDLDDDGYAEPYIVTFDLANTQVLRIVRRYSIEDVELQGTTKKIKKIKPTQMYTKFGFVPNPDGSFYDIGFGILLGPLNESVNTLINQLIDSGSLNNLQSGFIGKALKLRMGDNVFQPGEWKQVPATGDDLRKQIVPLPAKEPSAVLFQLMGTLITSGKELASVAEIFTGKMPGQNTPATTTMATVEQGMKVFTAVYKRIFRALGEEFLKIFQLNKTYIDPNKYVSILDMSVGPEDFDETSYDICPGADPTAVSQTEKLMKAQGLMELLPLIPGLLDPIKVISRVLEAQDQPNWQDLFSQEVAQSGQLPPPPPDPKLMAIQAKMEADQKKAEVDIQSKMADMELKSRDSQLQLQMKAQAHAQKMQQTEQSAKLKAASDIAMTNIFTATERVKGAQDVANKDQQHQQKMQQMKEQASAQKSKSKSGNNTR